MLRDDHVRDLSSAPSAADPRSPRLRRAGAKAVLFGPAAPAALPFEVVESKIRIPPLLAGTVSRTALVNRLRAAGAFPLVLVVAPAGYGKTTLLSQWATRDARPFAWVSLDERDNDPVAFLRHVAAALDQVESVPASALEPLREDEKSAPTRALPRLVKAIAARRVPFVLVLDGADLLTRQSTAAVTELVKHIPAGSMIVLSGRVLPKLPVAALRVGGPLLEIGPYELALSRREAEILLRAAGRRAERRGDRRALGANRGLGGRPLPCGPRARERDRNRQAARRLRRHRGRSLLRRLLPLRVPLTARAGATDVPAPHVGARDDVRPALRCRSGAEGIGSRAGGARGGEPLRGAARPAPGLLSLPPPLPRPAPAGAGRARAWSWFRRSTSARPTGSRPRETPSRRSTTRTGPATRTAPPESSARSP